MLYRAALEAKAKLYDRLTQGTRVLDNGEEDEETDEGPKYMVDFQRKLIEVLEKVAHNNTLHVIQSNGKKDSNQLVQHMHAPNEREEEELKDREVVVDEEGRDSDEEWYDRVRVWRGLKCYCIGPSMWTRLGALDAV